MRTLRTWLLISGVVLFSAGSAGALIGCGGSSTTEPTVDAGAEEDPMAEEAEDLGDIEDQH
jgi:hypothetical protein